MEHIKQNYIYICIIILMIKYWVMHAECGLKEYTVACSLCVFDNSIDF